MVIIIGIVIGVSTHEKPSNNDQNNSNQEGLIVQPDNSNEDKGTFDDFTQTEDQEENQQQGNTTVPDDTTKPDDKDPDDTDSDDQKPNEKDPDKKDPNIAEDEGLWGPLI